MIWVSKRGWGATARYHATNLTHCCYEALEGVVQWSATATYLALMSAEVTELPVHRGALLHPIYSPTCDPYVHSRLEDPSYAHMQCYMTHMLANFAQSRTARIV